MSAFIRYVVNGRFWLYALAILSIINLCRTNIVLAGNHQLFTLFDSVSSQSTDVNLSVLGNLEWQDTGVTIQPGETLTIQYISGLWSPWPGGFYDGRGVYDGTPCQQGHNCILFGVAHASLIGRIGSAEPFYIGNGTTRSVAVAERVYVRINDSRLEDNSGSLNIRIQVSSSNPQQTYMLMMPVIGSPFSPIIPETTNVLSQATTQYLTSVTDEGAVFTFTQMTPELASLSTGDVMVGDVSTAAPFGFLRKVISVSTKNKQVIVRTEPATLEDAIEQGEVHISKTLSPQSLQNSALASDVALQEAGVFSFELKDVVLYDKDGNQKTTNDQIRANGKVTLEPAFDFDMVITQSKLKQLAFTSNIKETVELEIESKVESSLIQQKYELPPKYLPPITIPIGVVPIVFVPVLTIHVGIDGSVHIGVTTGVTQQATLKAGARYENNTWNPEHELTHTFQPNLPTLSAGLDVKGYTGAQLALTLYGVVGPHVDVNAYLKLQADPKAVPWWKLFAGLEVPLGIEIKIFSRVLTSYQIILLDFQEVLAQADVTTSLTTRVSVASDGTQGNRGSYAPRISADGRYIVFRSSASNLVSSDTNNNFDVFVHDYQTGQIEHISVASDGTQANRESIEPSISADGRYVAFTSSASNLVNSDTNDLDDIFVHDRQTGQTERISIASDGTQGNHRSLTPAISKNGRYITFESVASNLVSSDTNDTGDIFVHDRQTGQTERISVASDGTQGNNRSLNPAISDDGRYVVFESYASNLVNGDTNGFLTADIFVHDRQTGQTERVSVASDGTQSNDGSLFPAISADGRYVSFHSGASNLVIDDTNSTADVFVHDNQTGQTERISVASDGTQGNNVSLFPDVSGDGRYVTFFSAASNLVSDDTNNTYDIFVYDRQTRQAKRISVASDGTQSNEASTDSAISADGRYVTFDSDASNLVSSDTNGYTDIFVHDRGNVESAISVIK